jgi:hypothetical protein
MSVIVDVKSYQRTPGKMSYFFIGIIQFSLPDKDKEIIVFSITNLV